MDFLKGTIKDLEKAGIEAGASAPPRYWYSTGNYVLNKIVAGSFLRGIPQGRLTCFTGPSGAGKAQPLAAKILTPNGWKFMGDIRVNDVVITPSGEHSNVTHIHPQGKKDVYTITFSDGSSTRCCIDHLWECWVFNHRKRKAVKQVVDTKFLINYITRQQTLNTSHSVSIDLISPIEYNEADLAIPPYLLGALLGDGNVTTNTPLITSADPEILENISTLLDENYELNPTKHDQYSHNIRKKVRSSAFPNKYTTYLKKLGIWGNRAWEKHIPEIYKTGSINQRLQLVRGLMDTDGTVNTRGNVSFGTTSYQLATDLQNILWSLGAKCSITSRIPFYKTKDGEKIDGRVFFTLNIHYKNPQELFTLYRKKERCKLESQSKHLRRRIKSIELTSHEAAQCITIDHPTHLYITDDYIITHNSFLACNAMREAQLAGAHIIVLDSENALDDEFVTKIGVDITENYTYFSVDTIPQVKKVVSAVLNGYNTEYGNAEDAPQLLFVIDSLDMLLTETENEQFDKGITKGDQGQRNKQLKAMLRGFVQKLKRPNTAMIVTDGVYKNQDVMNGEGVWMVKDAVKFSLSQIIMLTKLKLKGDTANPRLVTGIKMKSEGYKTRFTQPFQTVTIEVPYETGIDPYNGLLAVAVELGLVKKKGARYAIDGIDGTFYGKDFGQYAGDILVKAEAMSDQFLDAVIEDDHEIDTTEDTSAKSRRKAKIDAKKADELKGDPIG